MKEFKSSIASKVILFICAVFMVGGFFFYKFDYQTLQKTDQFIQDKEALLRLLQNSSEIHRMWNEGEESREWELEKVECLKHFAIKSPFDETLLRCNPMVLTCHELLNKKINYRFVKYSTNNNYAAFRYLTKSNTALVGLKGTGFLFTLEDLKSQKKLDVFLEDQCHEVFLQKRIYAYGEELPGKDSEDYRFDNFSQNIYLDTHLVTNDEINNWIDFGDRDFTKGLTKKSGNELFLPATDLMLWQMESYCSFKGKQLMLAHIFDAASFFPMDLNDITPAKNNRFPYYWTKKKSEFKADCNLIYAKECLGQKEYSLNTSAPSWAGLKDSMGGVLEAFRNPIDPESNLKASSFYFSFNSPWHKLGFRAGWDGTGFELRHFDFKGINPDLGIDRFKVGFRCMKEAK